jgi:hypothetical protein
LCEPLFNARQTGLDKQQAVQEKLALLACYREVRIAGVISPSEGRRPYSRALPTGVTIDGRYRLEGGACMSLQDRIEALKEKHAALERALDEENKRPLPNQDAVHDLKRQKLRIKDEICQLERH